MTIEGKQMQLYFYNSDGRAIQSFIPFNQNEVSLYCCGPTVYNYAHIGNLRSYLFEDLLKRTLIYIGNYSVNHVLNITDIGHLTGDNDDGEDKMVKSAKEKAISVLELAKFYTDSFFQDCQKLNILEPTIICKATEHINDMIIMIKQLEGKRIYLSGWW